MRAPHASTRPLPPRQRPLPPGWSRASDPIYARVWRLGGLPGKPPPVYRVPMEPGMLGQQAGDAVWLNPRTARSVSRLGIPSGGNRDLNALNVLLHEYAHVGQRGPLKPALLEGGADAWAAQQYGRVARALGLPKPAMAGIDRPPVPGYPQFIRPTWQQGRGFVERGQFGRR